MGDMDALLERLSRWTAIQMALVSAAVHLLWVWPRFSVSLLLNPVSDVRPFLFVPAALVLLAVAVALFRGYYYRRLSSLGGGTLGSLLVGFLLWEGTAAADTLASDPIALVAFVAELVGVVAFGALYYFHHPDRFGSAGVAGSEQRTDTEADS